MFGKKSEMDYQFNPDPVDKKTAFENLKFIDEDKNGLGALNAGYCHSFAPFTLFMSSPTFIRTIRLFKKEQLQLYNELKAFVQDKSQLYNYSCNKYPTLRTLLQKVYGNGLENNNMAWNSVVYVLYFIAKICACTDKNGKIIENKGRSDKYNKGSSVDVNAKRLYEAIIEFRDSHNMNHYSEFGIFLSFLTHCSFIMGNGKLSSVPLQNGIILNIESGERLEQNEAWKKYKDSFLEALSEAGDRAIVSAGGNHIFVFYRGNDNRYHAIGSLENKTYDSIEDAVRAWPTPTGTITITTQKPQKALYESHVDGQLNAYLAVQDIKGTLAYLCKKSYYDDNSIPYTCIDYGCGINDYVDGYTMKNWGLKAHDLKRAEQLQQTRSSVFENIDEIANGIPMNNQELMNNQKIMNNNMNFNNNGNNVNFNNMNNQMINNMNNFQFMQLNMNNPMIMNNQIMNNNQFMKNNMNNNFMMNNGGMNPRLISQNNMNNQNGMNCRNRMNNMGMNNMGNQMMMNVGMNPQIMPTKNIVNNNVNNQIGMNTGMNNPVMNGNNNNNLNEIHNDGSRNVSNQEQSNILSYQNQSYASQQQDLNNNTEHLLGLSCLPKISHDTLPCCEMFYWKPCC